MRGKSLAVDANNYLYQFLALIRTRDGTPLKDKNGNITSHLAGLLFRSTRFIQDYEIKLIFAFDGEPPKQKQEEIAKAREDSDENKWIVKYISTDDDDVASVWVYAENREEAIENAEEDNSDIGEIGG